MEYKGQKYTFDTAARIGGGGMAEVYLAVAKEDPKLKVAVKVPLPSLPPEVASLFLREAAAATEVSSPHVVPVVDWGEEPPFIAFEYIEGTTLGNELRARAGLGSQWELPELLRTWGEMVAGMKAINARVIHRDLKPDNIFLSDVVRIADFGIAKYVGEATRTNTFKGSGTPPYMAPESFRLDAVDWQADQYSLGVVFYEMSVLHQPFSGTFDELEQKHLYKRPDLVTTIRPELPQRISTMIARMLEKRPADRFESWDEIEAELKSLEVGAERESESDAADDPLAKAAAEQLEEKRSGELLQRQEEETQLNLTRDRESLLEYWANEFFSALEERIGRLNKSLGEGAIGVTRYPLQFVGGLAQYMALVHFLKAELTILLQTVPIDGPAEAALWGYIHLKTNNRISLSNLLLEPQPEPHGTWFEVELTVSPIMEPSFNVGDPAGGDYLVQGQNRIVLARNWQALLHQLGQQHVMSEVDVKKGDLNFEALLEHMLTILVEDGNADPPQPPPRRGDDFFGNVRV